MGDPLFESVSAQGRRVRVTTYRDGDSPVYATLIFRTAEDAAKAGALLDGSSNLVDGLALLEVAGEHAIWSNEILASGRRTRCHCRWESRGDALASENETFAEGRRLHRVHQLAEFRARVGAGGGR